MENPSTSVRTQRFASEKFATCIRIESTQRMNEWNFLLINNWHGGMFSFPKKIIIVQKQSKTKKEKKSINNCVRELCAYECKLKPTLYKWNENSCKINNKKSIKIVAKALYTIYRD